MAIEASAAFEPKDPLADALGPWRAQYPAFGALLDEGAPLSRALRYLGLALWQDQRLEAAASIMAKNALLAPNDPVILGEFGCLLGAAGRTAEAIRYLTDSLASDPNQAQIWLNLAVLSKAAGDAATAERAFRAALKLAPDSAEAAAGLGLLYLESRRIEDAARLLRAAVERGVAVLPVYACLGQALFMLGDFAGAGFALEKAARACPGEARLVQKFAECRLIERVIAGSVAEAIETYRFIAGGHAEDILSVCRKSFLTLCGYGRNEAAIRLGEALLASAPDDAIVSYQIDALRGRPHTRAPSGYLTACFDRFAPDFERHLVEVLDYRIPEKLIPLLVETGLRFPHILDLGCGTGLAAPHLSRFGSSLTGVDIAPRMLDKARERDLYDQLIEREAVSYLSEAEEQFDLIVALDVVIYFGDLGGLFTAAWERLAPGGVFAFSFETAHASDYKLLPSGRFAHDPAYVERLCGDHFGCLASLATTLRLEANRPVEGRIVLLRKEPALLPDAADSACIAGDAGAFMRSI